MHKYLFIFALLLVNIHAEVISQTMENGYMEDKYDVSEEEINSWKTEHMQKANDALQITEFNNTTPSNYPKYIDDDTNNGIQKITDYLTDGGECSVSEIEEKLDDNDTFHREVNSYDTLKMAIDAINSNQNDTQWKIITLTGDIEMDYNFSSQKNEDIGLAFKGVDHVIICGNHHSITVPKEIAPITIYKDHIVNAPYIYNQSLILSFLAKDFRRCTPYNQYNELDYNQSNRKFDLTENTLNRIWKDVSYSKPDQLFDVSLKLEKKSGDCKRSKNFIINDLVFNGNTDERIHYMYTHREEFYNKNNFSYEELYNRFREDLQNLNDTSKVEAALPYGDMLDSNDSKTSFDKMYWIKNALVNSNAHGQHLLTLYGVENFAIINSTFDQATLDSIRIAGVNNSNVYTLFTELFKSDKGYIYNNTFLHGGRTHISIDRTSRIDIRNNRFYATRGTNRSAPAIDLEKEATKSSEEDLTTFYDRFPLPPATTDIRIVGNFIDGHYQTNQQKFGPTIKASRGIDIGRGVNKVYVYKNMMQNLSLGIVANGDNLVIAENKFRHIYIGVNEDSLFGLKNFVTNSGVISMRRIAPNKIRENLNDPYKAPYEEYLNHGFLSCDGTQSAIHILKNKFYDIQFTEEFGHNIFRYGDNSQSHNLIYPQAIYCASTINQNEIEYNRTISTLKLKRIFIESNTLYASHKAHEIKTERFDNLMYFVTDNSTLYSYSRRNPLPPFQMQYITQYIWGGEYWSSNSNNITNGINIRKNEKNTNRVVNISLIQLIYFLL